MEFHDQPATTDTLGRNVYAESLAALFLNPEVKSPITVGICGDWGKGKSSLMIQTEIILLRASIERALSNLSKKAEHKEIVEGVKRLLDSPEIERKTQYRPKYHAVLKYLAWYLACMDLDEERRDKPLPMILTVTYNAWHYRNEREAWAGLAVQITNEIERTMTNAQKLSTSWRYAWKNDKLKIWIQVFLPCLLALILAGWIAWAAWLLLDRSKDKQLTELKYGSIPATVVGIIWFVFRSVMGVLKPISAHMLAYMRLPDHTAELGYQQKVIEDITYLKKQILETPSTFSRFIAGEWCWNWFGLIDNNVEGTTIPKRRAASIGKKRTASDDNLRILVFVDDLDRCEDSVILKVLAAINLVLATCEIDVILAMDKSIVKRAINKSFRQTYDPESARELEEKYISKIIQLPLDLPDLSAKDSKTFYMSLLGAENEPGAAGPTSEHSSGEERSILGAQALNIIVAHPGHDRSQGIVTIRTLNTAECKAFPKLMEYAAGRHKLPRECKRFINYYRLASHILYESEDFSEVKDIRSSSGDNIGREVQLMTWVFVCWGWKTEIDTLLQDLTAFQTKDYPPISKKGDNDGTHPDRQNGDGGPSRTTPDEDKKPSLATLVGDYYEKTWPKEEKQENQSPEPRKGKNSKAKNQSPEPLEGKEPGEAKWAYELRMKRERRRQRFLKLKEPLQIYDVSWKGILCFQGFRPRM